MALRNGNRDFFEILDLTIPHISTPSHSLSHLSVASSTCSIKRCRAETLIPSAAHDIPAMDHVLALRPIIVSSRIYVQETLPLARDALEATLEASHLTIRLVFRLTRPFLLLFTSLLRLAAPILRRLSLHLWTIICLQPTHILAAEALFAFVLLLLILIERRYGFLRRLHAATLGMATIILRRYRKMLSNVRAKSRLAAAALPHLLFLTIATLVQYLAGHYLTPITQGPGMVILTVAIPAWHTILLLYSVDIEPPATPQIEPAPVTPSPTMVTTPTTPLSSTPRPRRRRRQKSSDMRRAAQVAAEIENDGNTTNVPRTRFAIEAAPSPSTPPVSKQVDDEDDSAIREKEELDVLRFWVLFGITWTVRSVVWFFTPALLSHFMARFDTLLFWWFLWLQIGATSGSRLIYRLISKAARRRWRLDARKKREARLEQLGLIMRMLVSARVVTGDRAASLTNNFAESGFALIGVVFLVTPRVATFLGTLLIGLLVPCYLSTSMLETGADGLSRHNWLSYWAVIALLDALLTLWSDFISWLPLWYHAKMVLILWLQLPYYRGCVVLLDYFMGHVGSALSTVRKQAVTPRKRKRA